MSLNLSWILGTPIIIAAGVAALGLSNSNWTFLVSHRMDLRLSETPHPSNMQFALHKTSNPGSKSVGPAEIASLRFFQFARLAIKQGSQKLTLRHEHWRFY